MGSNASPGSAVAGLVQLSEDELRVLVALTAELDPARLPDFSSVDLAAITDRLRVGGLLRGDGAEVDESVAQAFGRFPAGLAPVSIDPLDDAQIADALDKIGPDEHRVLERLVWGPPQGTVTNARRAVTWQDASSPIDRLLALGLLRPVDEGTVVLPREVALVLRGGCLFDIEGGRPALPRFETPASAPATGPESEAPIAGNDWRPVLEKASRDDLWVQLAYAEEDGTLSRATIRVLLVAHGSAYLVRRAGARLNIPANRIVAAHLLEPVVINDPVLDQEGRAATGAPG